MSDLLTVVGTNGGITEKANGWYEVQVNVPGKQYPVKLATKRNSLMDLVRAVGEEIATFSYTEKESERINENTGKPYINRYLEGAEAGGTPAPASGSGGGSGGGAKEDVDWDAKERRDYRSRAWAQTLGAFSHTIKPDEDPLLVFGRLRGFQRAVYEDVVRDLDPTTGNPVSGSGTQLAQQRVDEPDFTHDDDDDIPF